MSALADFDALFAGRVAVTMRELAAALGYHRNHLLMERQRGRLRTIGKGRAVRVAVSDARSYVALLEAEAAQRPAPYLVVRRTHA